MLIPHDEAGAVADRGLIEDLAGISGLYLGNSTVASLSLAEDPLFLSGDSLFATGSLFVASPLSIRLSAGSGFLMPFLKFIIAFKGAKLAGLAVTLGASIIQRYKCEIRYS